MNFSGFSRHWTIATCENQLTFIDIDITRVRVNVKKVRGWIFLELNYWERFLSIYHKFMIYIPF